LLEGKFGVLRNLLSAYFNQDIESPEEALQEYIEENTKKRILITIEEIDKFLSEDLPQQEKELFIEDNCYLYFPALELTPIEWLKQVQDEFKRAVDLG
jgi:CdiI immunity protein